MSVVAGLWLLHLGRVWYNLPVLFPGFSAFFPPSAWVTPIPGFQEGNRVLGGVAPALYLLPQSRDLKASGRGLNEVEGGFSFNENYIQPSSLTFPLSLICS